MPSGKAKLDWEFGDVMFWVAFGREKPFPVVVFRADKQWKMSAHPHRPLTECQQADLDAWFVDKQTELTEIWSKHINIRLNWPTLERKNLIAQGDDKEKPS